MMIATTPFVAVGLLFSLTAEPADLGRKSGTKQTEEDEAVPTAGDAGSQTGNGDVALVSEKPADAM